MTASAAPAATAPTLARRFGALLVDWILCLLVSGLFARPLTDGWAPVVVLIAEYAFFVGIFGQTPGMKLARFTCMSASTGLPVGIPRAALRGLLLALVIPALLGAHDRIAGTVLRRLDPDTV
ncbi:RDD family protein [Allorhizocola rhizosphaerae]|uniref:RDD family protein n=1 Tax=Allorhizocola rhizosphaerae TaxID=1872709 RepID=UPI000E3CB294|nr:RDD family protein [Allorhizocola rhizosphaerae]